MPPGLTTHPSLTRSGLRVVRSEEHTSELQSPCNLVCRLLLEKKKERHSITSISKAPYLLVAVHTAASIDLQYVRPHYARLARSRLLLRSSAPIRRVQPTQTNT